MAREDAATKARRLLGEGRLTVIAIGDDRILARCRGDEAEVYVLGRTPGGWACSCATLGRCSHIRALQLVVLVGSGQ